jgi:Tfp pilus assembly protein PilN
MKLLDEGSSGIKLNLLPKEIVSVKKAKKEMLIIVNVAACLFVLLFLYIALLSKKSINIGQYIFAKKQKQQLNVNMLELVKSRKDISEKTKVAENTLAAVRRVVRDRNCHNWAGLLADMANAVPQTVLIQNLQGRDDNTMKIDGLAVSFEAVNDFIGLLGKSKGISSVSLASANRNMKFDNGLIDYSIVCSLSQ